MPSGFGCSDQTLKRKGICQGFTVDEDSCLRHGWELQDGLFELCLHTRRITFATRGQGAGQVNTRFAASDADAIHLQVRLVERIIETGLAIMLIFDRK